MKTKLKKWYLDRAAKLIGRSCFWHHLVALNELLNSNSSGVFIDSTLSRNAHIDYIVKKAAKHLYFLEVLKRSGLTSDQ